MLLLLRFLTALLGGVMLLMITGDLLDGEIMYGIGNVTVEQVTTKTLAEAVSLWAAFASLFIGLIILGMQPELYVEQRWLWKVLLAIIMIGYVATNLLR